MGSPPGKPPQRLVAALYRSQTEAAELLHRIERHSRNAQGAHDLAYILHAKASANGWADEAAVYNTLIAACQTLRDNRPRANSRALTTTSPSSPR